ncbi:MAG: hypothetical protein OXT74_17445 [Candidatus Poribacteria bacterium]|nr:hypothetical protein [Candidatus Poribacteria bacterium]
MPRSVPYVVAYMASVLTAIIPMASVKMDWSIVSMGSDSLQARRDRSR